MQSDYTGTSLKKKDRHRTRKFSADQPYDRASDAMLANSSLGGGRKLSLRQGTLIQSQPDSMRAGYSPLNFAQQVPPTNNTGLTANPTFTNASQNYVQPGLTSTPVNYGTQNYVQQGYSTNTGNTIPANFSNQNYVQPTYNVNNAGNTIPANYNTQNYVQPNYNTIPANYSAQNYVQPEYNTSAGNNIAAGYGTQNYVQQEYSANAGNTIPATYDSQNYVQPEYNTNAGTTTPAEYDSQNYVQPENNTVANSNIVENYGTQAPVQPEYNTIADSNDVPADYSAQTPVQTEQIANAGIPADYDTQTSVQPEYNTNASTDIPADYVTQSSVQPEHIVNADIPADYDAQPSAQPEYNTNASDHIPANRGDIPIQPEIIDASDDIPVTYSTEGLPQQNYDSQGLVQQNFSQPGLIGGTVLGTGLVAGTAYAENTLAQNSAQPEPTVAPTTSKVDPTTKTDAAASNKKIDSNAAGVFTFKPLEGKFPKDKDIVGKMDPYCKIKIGMHGGKTAVAKGQGAHPVWSDAITIQKKHNEQFAKLKVRDHETLKFDEVIGETKIPLGEIATRGKINQWYPIYKKDQLTGEILMEISFQPKSTAV